MNIPSITANPPSSRPGPTFELAQAATGGWLTPRASWDDLRQFMVQNKRTLAQETREMTHDVANIYAGLRFMALNEKPGSPDAIRATVLFKGLRVAVVESNKAALEERMAAARILLEGYFGPKNEVPRGI